MKKLGVLGSTGSVGSQTLEVVQANSEDFEVVGLLARRASEKLLDQAKKFRPKYVACYDEPEEDWLRALPENVKFLKGEEGLHAIVEDSELVMNSISGVDGIMPTYLALTRGKKLLASNKESLICLGNLVKEKNRLIVPVDSEHNAIFQLLSSVERRYVKKVYLTASGGPFREKSAEELRHVSVQDALMHPTWKMGTKITVDSATLMNKGMEIIEAINLFQLPLESVDVLIHPQSVVHGIVELIDGGFILHASQTDMRVPILYSLYHPERKTFPFDKKSILELSPINFEKVDTNKFKSLSVCRGVALMGGIYPSVLVGADQIAVELFLGGRIGFIDIVDLVEEILALVTLKEPQSFEDVLFAVQWAYNKGRELVEVRG